MEEDDPIEFDGLVVEWRGPAPYYFIAIPVEESEDVKLAAKGLEYWGQVPVLVTIGRTDFRTALFPKGGAYLLPVRDAVRRATGVELDDLISVTLRVGRG